MNAMESGQAVWFEGMRQVIHRPEVAPPPAGPMVRVRAAVSAISHGTEMLVYRGEVPACLDLDLPTLAGSFQYPVKYGYACVGRILDVGESVESCRPGDQVFAFHPHQTVFTIGSDLVVRLPDSVSPCRAAFLANLETAVNLMLDTPIGLGETVAVFGAGTVGLLSIGLACRRGAGQVIAVDPIPGRRTLAKRFGADVVLDPIESPADCILDLTDGRGADVILEASGNPAALQCAVDSLAFGGTIVVGSWYGTKAVTLELGARFHRQRGRIVSSQVSSIDPALSRRWSRDRRLQTAAALLPNLPLESLVTHRFPFADAAEAYRLIDACPEEVLQVVLEYPGSANRQEAV